MGAGPAHPGSRHVLGTHYSMIARMWVLVTSAFLLMFPYCETSKNRRYVKKDNTNTLRSVLTVSTMHVHGHNDGLLMS